DKLKEVRRRIDESGREIRLEIDGGVKIDNIADIAAAGADTFVSGSAIFGSDDYARTIAEMKTNILSASGA
ncbi:MAG: ribulose-phosphate 3-epimerase, partial [Candidatus Azotimanducaceae bacterium]